MGFVLPKIVTLAVISTVLVACTGNSDRSLPPPPIGHPHQAPDSILSENREIRLFITSAKKFTSIAADKNDKPRHYVVRGRVISARLAQAEFKKGQVLCYSRIIKTRVRDGETIVPTEIVGGQNPSSADVFYVNIAHLNPVRKSAVGIVCTKLGSPIRYAEATRALRGIVRFVH